MIKAKAEEKSISIYIYGDIESGGSYWEESEEKSEGQINSVDDLHAFLEAHKDAGLLDIYINSPGGDVFESVGIYNILKRSRAYKRVYIDGMACSGASVIAMAGNSITMPKSSLMMIHNAWTVAMGNADEFRKIADTLDTLNDVLRQAYMTQFKGSEEELKALMDAESYLTADQCYEMGFCTKLSDDGKDTEEKVDEAMNQSVKMYTNKLNQLASIKNAIKAITDEADEAEPVKEPEGEIGKEAEAAKEDGMPEPEHPVKVSKEEAKEQVEKVKQTALQKFFGYEPEGKED